VSDVSEIIKYLLIFIAVMFALLIVLVIVVSRLPNDTKLKRILNALVLRVGATLGVGVLAIPIEPIPGLDGLYDIAAPLILLYYWCTFVRKAIAVSRTLPSIGNANRR
jgi:heme A synthase